MKELKDVYIIDDVIPELHADYLSKYYTSHEVDWFFQKDITFHKTDDKFIDANHNAGFANLIFSLGHVSSPLYHTIAPIMYAALDTLKLEPLRVLKARAFLQLPVADQQNEVNNAHRDVDINHIVILYYLTDADGETIIYNETEESDEYTVKERVAPKKGRCVIFDGKHYHSSSKPTNGIRVTININVII